MFAVGKKLLLGPSEDTSKLLFRQSLVRLSGASIAATDVYWSQFWLVPEAASEFPSLLPAEILRHALTANPSNITTLLSVTCHQLFTLLADPRFSLREQTSKSYFAPAPQNDLTRQALNCVRVLSRILPFVHERTATRAEEHRLFHGLFWKAKKEEVDQFVIDDDEEEDRQDMAAEVGPVLAERLLDTTIDLLFTSGFTIPHSNDQEDQRTVRYAIWQAGIGSSSDLPSERHHLRNRAEVLRLLLVLLSPAVYSPNSPNPWLQHLLAITERKIALTLLCSLINTALDVTFIESFQLSTTNAYKRLAALTLSAEAKQAEDLAKDLPKLSLQLLDLFLIASDPPSQTASSPTISRTPSLVDTTTASTNSDNVFRFYTAKIHRQSDYAFLAERILLILSVAPPSGLGIGLGVPEWNLTESVVLLWRLVDCNKGFMNYLLEAEHAPDLLVCLLNICLDNKDDPAQFGLVRLCVFTLQSLTAEKTFGKQLSKSLEKISGGKRHAPQCASPKAADHLVVSVYTLIFGTQRTFNSLYPALILCITNCSAHLKNLSAVASTRLMQLFLAFSQPSFILAEDGNPRLLYYLVEAFNNIIHYQLSENPHLIYGIIRSHRRFESLASFTLRGAVDEIRRVRTERKSSTDDASTRPEIKSTPSSTSLASIGTLLNEEKFDGTDEEDPVRMSEKARGKMRERENSSDSLEDPGALGPYRSKSGFVPTEAWVASWREHLPLDSILIMLAELRPKVSSLTSVDSPSTNQAVLDFLKSVTLLDVLPQRPPYGSRRFVHSSMSLRWLLSLVWSLVYQSLPFLSGTKIALFNVQESQPRDLISAVRDGTRRLTGGGGGSPARTSSAVV